MALTGWQRIPSGIAPVCIDFLPDSWIVEESTAFIAEPAAEGPVGVVHEASVASDGYVPNYVRVWCWRPEILTAFAQLRADLLAESTLTAREVAVMVAAAASELGDSYCSLAWGEKLAEASDESIAAAVLRGEGGGLSEREAALARWARQVVRDPNGTSGASVEGLRQAGVNEREIFEATAWIGLRLAFSSINDALGISPDIELRERVPAAVREAVSYGR